MKHNLKIILDIGKTFSKLSLWSAEGTLLDSRSRPNGRPTATLGYPCLDARGIETWFAGVVTDFARQGIINHIVPVGHGAAACVIGRDGTWLAPIDYEAELPAELRQTYLATRDSFSLTGSPYLPCGLNLGAQLHWLESLAPEQFGSGTIVTWPQFWAWRLCGVAATEVTSLGCHTDLWLPMEKRPSPMAEKRGWAKRFAPLHAAGDILGPISEIWRERCGLPADCVVLCGLHDSNAALLAMRGYSDVAGREHTVLSTGTWFIAMHATLGRQNAGLASLPEARDCLVNVDAFGHPVASARFMGGREAETLEAAPQQQLDAKAVAPALFEAATRIIADEVFALPSFQPGVGPFPKRQGTWVKRPDDQLERRAATDLYLALVTNTALNLVGSAGPVVAEGRFSGDPLFMRALASLRSHQRIFAAPASASVSYGALRLIAPDLPPSEPLEPVTPLDLNLDKYAVRWNALTG